MDLNISYTSLYSCLLVFMKIWFLCLFPSLFVLGDYVQWALRWLWLMEFIFPLRSLPQSRSLCWVMVCSVSPLDFFLVCIFCWSSTWFWWSPVTWTGISDIEIYSLQIKFTATGVYLESEIVGHLQQWKGKAGNVLAEDTDFFEALISGRALVELFLSFLCHGWCNDHHRI